MRRELSLWANADEGRDTCPEDHRSGVFVKTPESPRLAL